MGKKKFERIITEFKQNHLKGEKEPIRATDSFAKAKSPLKQINPPLTKMFYEGVPRILNSGISIFPCFARNDNRTALETYPAQLARIFTGRYKNIKPEDKHYPNKNPRELIISGLLSLDMTQKLGFSIQIEKKLISLAIEDNKGDILDSFLCTVQAGWAWTKKITVMVFQEKWTIKLF